MKRYILADEKSGLVCGLSFWRDSPPTELMPGMIVVGEITNDEDYPVNKVWDGKEFIEPPRDTDIGEHINEIVQVSVANQRASRVMFRALAQTDVIKTEDALDNSEMFPVWADCIGQRAEAGSYWRHGDKLYRVNAGQGHTIQADWAPDKAASLFSLAANPAEEWPEWIQPTGAHNAYTKGANVTHNGKRWTSTADGNVWEPGVFGWEEVE